MKKLTVVLCAVMLSGCEILSTSFYDDNESMAITNITARVQFLDCESKTLKKRLNNLDYHIEWLKQYTSAKGSKDIYDLAVIMDGTLEGMLKQENMSPAYCRIKVRNLDTQSKMAAEAIMGRF